MGSRHYRRVDDLVFAVHPDMRFHPEIPLSPFPRLVHLGIAFLLAILRRTRGVDDRGIDDGAGRDLDAPILQMNVDRFQHGSAEAVLFEQVAKLADRGFVRHWFVAKIDSGKAAHQRRVVQDFLHRRIRKVKPLLKEVDSQHAHHANGTTSVARPGIMGFDQGAQFVPGNHLLHLFQKQRTLRLLRVPTVS